MLSIDQVRSAITESHEVGNIFLTSINVDSGAVFFPTVLLLLFGLMGILVAVDHKSDAGRPRLTAAVLGAGSVCLSALLGWAVYITPIEGVSLSSGEVILQADAYLSGKQVSIGHPTVVSILDARGRVEHALSDAERIARKLALVSGEPSYARTSGLTSVTQLLALR